MRPLFLALVLLVHAHAHASAADSIAKGLKVLADISGLEARRPIRSETITRERVTAFLNERIKEDIKPEDIRIEALVLRKFGLIPADFDLAKTTVDLLSEQAAAFYDFHKKRLYLLDTLAGDTEETALVHELAHALADQHFNLKRFIKQSGASDDAALAHLAVMEGQANWLMAESLARDRGETLIGRRDVLEAMNRQTESGAESYPVFRSVPLYLRQSLVFPYTDGMNFQHEVVEKLGKSAFAAVFRNPPVSTQQILHPEKYFDKVEPTHPKPDPIPSRKGFRKVAEGNVGEFDISILLRQYLGDGEARRIAPHWRGGQYEVWEKKDRSAAVLTFAMDFDSPENAREFRDAYAAIVEKKGVTGARIDVAGSTVRAIE